MTLFTADLGDFEVSAIIGWEEEYNGDAYPYVDGIGDIAHLGDRSCYVLDLLNFIDEYDTDSLKEAIVDEYMSQCGID